MNTRRAAFVLFSTALCAAAFAQTPTPGDKTVPLTVMTYNIRYGTAPDTENAWDLRKDPLIESVRLQDPDIIGTQEGLDFQLDYIREKLGPNYRWFGVARDPDGTGEHSAVFYRRDRLAPVETGNFWLSETPDRSGTKSWGVRHNRLVTWARFVHFATGRSFMYYNTHLDHASEEARVEGARLIAKRFASQLGTLPVIVTGDFNAIGEASDPWRVLTTAGLQDAWCIAKSHAGPECTFNGFKPFDPNAKGRIDWILVSPSAEVESCAIVDQATQGRFPSDHFPVVAHLNLPE